MKCSVSNYFSRFISSNFYKAFRCRSLRTHNRQVMYTIYDDPISQENNACQDDFIEIAVQKCFLIAGPRLSHEATRSRSRKSASGKTVLHVRKNTNAGTSRRGRCEIRDGNRDTGDGRTRGVADFWVGAGPVRGCRAAEVAGSETLSWMSSHECRRSAVGFGAAEG